MSGLYNVVFGHNELGPPLVGVLNAVQLIHVGRYRDAWLEKHDDEYLIHIYTRNGGGNREEFVDEIESMRNHPWFVRDSDDEYDSTYANFYFRLPGPIHGEVDATADGVKRDLYEAMLNAVEEPVDMANRWETLINKTKQD